MQTWIQRLFVLVIVAPALVIAALWFAPRFIPAEKYREQIDERLEDYTGRSVKIAGDIRFSFLPRLQLEVTNVTIGHPDGLKLESSAEMIALNALYVNVRVLPLLAGRVDIDRFELVQPSIELARDSKGQPNWIFTPKTQKLDAKKEAAKEEAAKEESGGSNPTIKELAVQGIVIRDGLVTYRENPTATPVKLSNIQANLKLPSLSDTATLSFSADAKGAGAVSLNGTLTTPGQFLAGEDAFIALTGMVGDKALEAKITGNIVKLANDGFNLTGDASIHAASAQKLMQALGSTPPAGSTDQSIALSGKVRLAGDAASIQDLKASLGATEVTGALDLALPEKGNPKLQGKLAFAKPLDITPYLATPAEPKAEEKPEQPKEVVVEPARTEGWNTARTLPDFSFLRNLDATLDIQTEGLVANDLTLGAFKLVHSVKDGMARFQIENAALYDGTVALDATIDGRGADPVFVQRATLTQVNAESLLKAFGFDRLTGKVSGSVDLRSKGRSEAELVTQLNGAGNLAFKDGEIRGVSLTALVDQIKSVKAALKGGESTAVKEDATTKFSSLAGTFSVADGIARNNDLALLAPLLKATGSGAVNLPKRLVDYTIKPSLVASLEGQTRQEAANQAAITVPIRVTGPFSDLSYRPDASSLMEGLVKDPNTTVKAIEDNVKGLKGDFKSLFKGL